MTIADIRLTSSGILITNGEFDEVTKDHITFTKEFVYAAEFDEITGSPVPMRIPSAKDVLRVSNYFDEVTVPTQLIPSGQAAFVTAGTHSWTAPAGVTSVSVVAVGGGGGGGTPIPSFTPGYTGGGGGGLGWKNNIPVVPGQTYTVVVGAGGNLRGFSSPFIPMLPTTGGDSYFINATTVKGGGAQAQGVGGTYVGDGGGNGGSGYLNAYGFGQASGAGAGGYSGNGANGVFWSGGATNGLSGSGGGGGSGGLLGSGATELRNGGGGGVGILGRGSNGAGGTTTVSAGGGGSGGLNATSYGTGGRYGGGGAKSGGYNESSGAGANGAVRIIWGDGRAFPTTQTTDV